MSSLKTLIKDIYSVVDVGVQADPEDIRVFGEDLSRIVADRLSPRTDQPGYLRPSNIGEKCDRKLWYSVNTPELGERLTPETRLKFLIGDLHEAILLFLARLSGHEVRGQQGKVDISGVVGSRDAIIDGVVVDVKSASPFSFDKFSNGLTKELDAFGYLDQIEFYRQGSIDDPDVTDSSRAAFLVSDKVLGKLTLDVHPARHVDFVAKIEAKRAVLASPKLPSRGYHPVPEGKSGNERLGIECSYCPFKRACWPGLRTFLYSSGPKFLTRVEREPDVSEVY